MIIQSLERAFAILELFAENGGTMRLSEIATTLELHRTTVHNLLDTLNKLGYLEQPEASPRYRNHPKSRVFGRSRMFCFADSQLTG